MFENLSDRLGTTIEELRGQGRLTEDNIRKTLREVRMALLESDVALPVVRQFIDDIRERALGAEVMQSLTPGQALVKIVQEELIRVLGEESSALSLRAQPPAIVLMAGLQGSGKTTTVAKLGRHLREREKKSVLVVSCDVYRPAAIDQLETLAGEVGVEFFPSASTGKPEDIAKRAAEYARKNFIDVLLVDTAGRLAIDEAMMREVSALHKTLSPAETLFVVDSMTGQDAAQTAKAFGDALPLTGVVLTKVDGDARGGAALSVRYVTGKPIKFLGVGEKVDALEVFHPDRIVSRILGMGDVMSLIEEAEQKIDRTKADRLVKKMTKGQRFDLEDLRDQLQQMQNMGGLGAMMEKLPGMGNMGQMVQQANMGNQFKVMETIINSMTPAERRNPESLNGSRKRRITQGSGTQIQDLNRLLKQYKQMAKMMKKMKGGGLQKMMRGMGGMLPGGGGGMPPGGGLPPGFPRK